MQEERKEWEKLDSYIRKAAQNLNSSTFKNIPCFHEDAANNTICKLLEEIKNGNEIRHPYGWVKKTLYREFCKEARKRSRIEFVEFVQGLNEAPQRQQDEEIIRQQLLNNVREKLKGNNRKVFELKLQGFENKEIAQKLNTSPDNVKNILKRKVKGAIEES